MTVPNPERSFVGRRVATPHTGVDPCRTSPPLTPLELPPQPQPRRNAATSLLKTSGASRIRKWPAFRTGM